MWSTCHVARVQRLDFIVGDLALHRNEGTIVAHMATREFGKIIQ